MNEYEVVINSEYSELIRARNVKLKSDNSLVFWNPRSSVSEQYLYGSEVIAVFNVGEYAYFRKR